MNDQISKTANWTVGASALLGGVILALVCIFSAPDLIAQLFAAAVLIGAAVSCAALWRVGLEKFRVGVGAAALTGILAAVIYFVITATFLVIGDSLQVLLSTRNSILMLRFSLYLTICSGVGGLISALVLRLLRSRKVA